MHASESGDGETVEVETIAAGGAGVGRLSDGRAVFVHRTAPGDRVRIEVTKSKRSWARGKLLSVLEPGPDRRDAPCRYYGRCGGCTVEHLEYPAQLAAKGRIVRDALERIAGRAIEEPEVTASPREIRYRNRVSFTLLRVGGGRVVAGFHELERPGRVVDMGGDCLLPEPAVAEAWDALRAGWGRNANRLPSGEKLRLTLRGTAEGVLGLLVEGGFSRGRPDDLLAAVPRLVAIWHRPAQAAPIRLLGGKDFLEEENGTLRLAGDVFLQVNREAAAALQAHVRALAGDVANLRVVDAYCGVGENARALAAAGAEVVGIEWSGAAVAEARRRGPNTARFEEGAVEDRLEDALPADLVIVNPPRTGLDAAVPALLADRPPRRLIYVSCDPATLARDLERLGPAFRLVSVRCFDLFPQTAHVETVALLACDTM